MLPNSKCEAIFAEAAEHFYLFIFFGSYDRRERTIVGIQFDLHLIRRETAERQSERKKWPRQKMNKTKECAFITIIYRMCEWLPRFDDECLVQFVSTNQSCSITLAELRSFHSNNIHSATLDTLFFSFHRFILGRHAK